MAANAAMRVLLTELRERMEARQGQYPRRLASSYDEGHTDELDTQIDLIDSLLTELDGER